MRFNTQGDPTWNEYKIRYPLRLLKRAAGSRFE